MRLRYKLHRQRQATGSKARSSKSPIIPIPLKVCLIPTPELKAIRVSKEQEQEPVQVAKISLKEETPSEPDTELDLRESPHQKISPTADGQKCDLVLDIIRNLSESN